MLGASHFGEHDSHHEGLRHDPEDRLHAHHEDRFRAFLRRGPHTVANGVLRFDGEEEAGRKVFDIVDTWCPVVVS